MSFGKTPSVWGNAENYRPISLNQHGFLPKSSTTTNLLDSINDWALSLKNKRNVAIACVDNSKAFDAVSHPKLSLKLTNWDITGNLLSWVKRFCPTELIALV